MGNPKRYVPNGGRPNAGLRPSVARLLAMVNVDDENYPKVVALLADMAEAGMEISEAAINFALKTAKADAEERRARRVRPDLGLPIWTDEGDKHSIVYYIRRGDLIKIGTTTRPAKRFESLLPDEIMAFEPGDRTVEMARHNQFWHLRQGFGEYFAQGPDLTRHIKKLRATHGEPDPSWRTTVNITESLKRRLPTDLPAPTSKETATVTEAAALLGVGMPTAYAWVRRNKIKRVGLNEKGRPVYYVEHFKILANHTTPHRRSR